MIEPEHQDVSSDQGLKQARAPIQLLRKLTIWVLEIVAEALGTCLIMVAMAFLELRHEVPPLHNGLTLSKVFGITLFILIEFAMTGYLATTLLSRFALRGRMQGFYPYVCAGLYRLDSNALGVKRSLTKQLAVQGGCIELVNRNCVNPKFFLRKRPRSKQECRVCAQWFPSA